MSSNGRPPNRQQRVADRVLAGMYAVGPAVGQPLEYRRLRVLLLRRRGNRSATTRTAPLRRPRPRDSGRSWLAFPVHAFAPGNPSARLIRRDSRSPPGCWACSAWCLETRRLTAARRDGSAGTRPAVRCRDGSTPRSSTGISKPSMLCPTHTVSGPPSAPSLPPSCNSPAASSSASPTSVTPSPSACRDHQHAGQQRVERGLARPPPRVARAPRSCPRWSLRPSGCSARDASRRPRCGLGSISSLLRVEYVSMSKTIARARLGGGFHTLFLRLVGWLVTSQW